MENKEKLTEAILDKAAQALGTTVNSIKKFNKQDGLNFFFGYTTNQHNHPIEEVINYFKDTLLNEYKEKEELKSEIESLKLELETLKSGNSPEEGKIRKIK